MNISAFSNFRRALAASLLWALAAVPGFAQSAAASASDTPPGVSTGANPTPQPIDTHIESWGDKFRQAGAVGWIQLGLSVFGGVFVFERLAGLRRGNLVPSGLSAKAKAMWEEGRFADLEQLGQTRPSTLARTISFIAQNRHSNMAEVSNIAGDIVSRELAIHYQRAYPLGIVATLAPLLGLLGMIAGMIKTFQTVAMAGALGDPTQLASGISEALVTTALGLAVAIPFLSFYHYFKYRTNGYGIQLEAEVTSLLTAWFLKPESGPRHPPVS